MEHANIEKLLLKVLILKQIEDFKKSSRIQFKSSKRIFIEIIKEPELLIGIRAFTYFHS